MTDEDDDLGQEVVVMIDRRRLTRPDSARWPLNYVAAREG